MDEAAAGRLAVHRLEYFSGSNALSIISEVGAASRMVCA